MDFGGLQLSVTQMLCEDSTQTKEQFYTCVRFGAWGHHHWQSGELDNNDVKEVSTETSVMAF